MQAPLRSLQLDDDEVSKDDIRPDIRAAGQIPYQEGKRPGFYLVGVSPVSSAKSSRKPVGTARPAH